MSYFVYVLMITSVLVFAVVLILFVVGLYLVMRPHQTKIFFSYSHKDVEIAERIVHRLNAYKFRMYVDFGLEIQTGDLKKELNNAIRKRDIFMLMASKNSADSYWVQFEINRAQQMDERQLSSEWRDMVIVALDNRGIEVARRLTESNGRRMRGYWNSEVRLEERWNEDFKTPSEKAKAEASLRTLRSFGDLFPYLRRSFTPEVRTFDLRGNFIAAMVDVEDYLKNTTRFVAIWPGQKYALIQKGIVAYLIAVLFMAVLFFGGWVLFLVSHLVV